MEKFIDSLLKIGLEYGEVVSVPDFESVRAGIPESTESVRSEDGGRAMMPLCRAAVFMTIYSLRKPH